MTSRGPDRRLRGRTARWGASGDDRGIAMLTVILMMIIVTALSILVLGIVVSEVTPTVFGAKNTRTVFAAEGGIDAALGQIRTARSLPDITGAIYGDPTKLPCAVTGPVNATGNLSYNVSISYYNADPSGQTDSTWIAAHRLVCTAGSGTAVDPTHALISSKGLDNGVAGLATTAGDRTLETVYSFNVTNTNVPGGFIYTFGDGFCLQANSTTIGSKVSYVVATSCGTIEARQLWSYTVDYQIKLSSTTTSTNGTVPPGLCVTGSSGDATLQTCRLNTDATRWDQLFSWEGGAHWRGENNGITGYGSVCLRSSVSVADLAGSTLQLGSCEGNLPQGSFNPDPRVGAGAASYQTKQIVSYLEFGRCFDVTDEDVNKLYMIVYPCKQDPSGGTQLFWNHKWYYAEAQGVPSVGPQQISINTNTNGTGTKYCLITPPVGTATAVAFVKLTISCSTSADDQKWTRYGNTGDYDTSYRFVDGYGRCASLGDKMPATPWTRIIVAPCSGGLEQKWNAPADSVSASVDNLRELTH